MDIFTKILVKQKLTNKYYEILINTLKMCNIDINNQKHLLKTIFIIIYIEIIFQ